jgi:hemerythrin-like metal-binding protein
MAILWSDGLSVGIKHIDHQTREMIARINRLIDALHSGKGAEEVESALKFLEAHVIVHFKAQEELMNEQGYPALQSHLSEHNYFRKEITRLRRLFNEGVDPSLLFNSTRKLCITWFMRHIDSVDRSLGRYIKTRGIKE